MWRVPKLLLAPMVLQCAAIAAAAATKVDGRKARRGGRTRRAPPTFGAECGLLPAAALETAQGHTLLHVALQIKP